MENTAKAGRTVTIDVSRPVPFKERMIRRFWNLFRWRRPKLSTDRDEFEMSFRGIDIEQTGEREFRFSNPDLKVVSMAVAKAGVKPKNWAEGNPIDVLRELQGDNPVFPVDGEAFDEARAWCDEEVGDAEP